MISNGSWVILNFTKSITLKVIALQHKRIIELMKQLISMIRTRKFSNQNIYKNANLQHFSEIQ
ncbi:hypothetical protein T03_9617 [Trichinella britovi]|uniref:Uncharacterized protein n=1 Tax=Trichinella britovi TaxID=45882 RepID=A0A0V1C6Y9_TRIBR|nr:hypothetical protein T03_9617 [Trichinella britovi]